jgi:hypothetical protein
MILDYVEFRVCILNLAICMILDYVEFRICILRIFGIETEFQHKHLPGGRVPLNMHIQHVFGPVVGAIFAAEFVFILNLCLVCFLW